MKNNTKNKTPLKQPILMIGLGVFCFSVSFAQQGIGIDLPHKSAALEIKSEKRGLLIPRVELEGEEDDTTMIDGNVESLLVYNISNQNGLQPGFYYWDGDKWNRLTNLDDLQDLEIEPWQIQNTTDKATDNDQNIYQEGNIAIGKIDNFQEEVVLDVHGNIRVGDFAEAYGDIGVNSVGMGKKVMASGDYSIAIGYESKALEFGAFAGGGYKGQNPITEEFSFSPGGAAEGKASFAFGNQTIALGDYTMAVGRESQAIGTGSVALNRQTKANGNYALAIGQVTYADGDQSFAAGHNSKAEGRNSIALGFHSTARTFNELVIGQYNALYNSGSKTLWEPEDPIFQIGNGVGGTTSRNNAMTVLKNGKVGIGIDGNTPAAAKPREMVDIGASASLEKNKVRIRDLPDTPGDMETDKVVVVNTTTANHQKGILRSVDLSELKTSRPWKVQKSANLWATENNQNIYQLGSVAVGADRIRPEKTGNNPQESIKLFVAGGIVAGNTTNTTNDIFGENSLSVGFQTKAIGNNSVAFGYKSKASGAGSFSGGGYESNVGGEASGESSFAFGQKVKAEGNRSAAFGSDSKAMDFNAFAAGNNTLAQGNSSFSMGRSTQALGNYSQAMGHSVISNSSYMATFGRFNKNLSVVSNGHEAWVLTEPLFVIGNGIGEANRSNALTILKNGWVGIGHHEPSANNEKLRVNGGILASNVTYPDYVFESYYDGKSKLKPDYQFADLQTIKAFINKNKHLPGILPASALERNENGHYEFNLTELTLQSLEKIEELYLHTIVQEEKIEKLENQVNQLKQKLVEMENWAYKISTQQSTRTH